MNVPLQTPAGVTPVYGIGVVTLDPEWHVAELIQVPATQSLLVGSMSFLDNSPGAGSITLQVQEALPGTQGAPGGDLDALFQVTVPTGGSVHLPFPTPLVLTPRDEDWTLRVFLTGSAETSACSTNILAVGSLF